MMNNNDNEEIAVASSSPPDLDAAKEALLARLGNQFGDLDVSNLLKVTTEEAISNNNSILEDGDDGSLVESEESSVIEPTQEELLQWQSTQFEKGKAMVESKKKERMSPLEIRRLEAANKNRKKRITDDHNNGSDSDDWEEVYEKPDLNGQTSIFFDNKGGEEGVSIVGTHPLLEKLANEDPAVLGGEWKKLYSSADGDGLSFYKLTDNIVGYNGPTVMFLSCIPSKEHGISPGTSTTNNIGNTSTATATIGFYTTTPWVESYDDYGSDDCFLFTINNEEQEIDFIKPITRLLPKEENVDDECQRNRLSKKHYMYCHPTHGIGIGGVPRTKKSSESGGKNKNDGIGIGGVDPSKEPRLQITKSLEGCRALSYCPLFESPKPLLPQTQEYEDCLWYFDVVNIEVWAVGGIEWINNAMVDYQKYKSRQEANLHKAQIVDKKQFVDDFRSGLFNVTANGGVTTSNINGNTLFGHVEHVDERTDLCHV